MKGVLRCTAFFFFAKKNQDLFLQDMDCETIIISEGGSFVMKAKRIVIAVIAAILLMGIIPAAADRIPEEKPWNYIGAMQVCWCNEFISLREEPRKTSRRLMEIPLGDIVYSCIDIRNDLFVECEYKGIKGYALRKYLKRAPEFEPHVSSAVSRKMTKDELIGTGEVVLDWKDYNMSVIAAHEYITENRKTWEVLRVGCFINDQPYWGHEEKVEAFGQTDMLKVFIGGVPDDWQVMLFDGGFGLSRLDLLSGKEKWCVRIDDCPMGNASAAAVDENGTIYIAGSDGPDPVAISMDGRVLWKSAIGNPDVYGPYEMSVKDQTIQVKYKSGMENGYKLVTFDSTGTLLSIRNHKE